MCPELLTQATALPTVLTAPFTGSVSGEMTRGCKNPLWRGVHKRLKKLRSQTTLSMRDLASLSCCSHVTVGAVERAKNTPTVDVIAGLALALGVSPTYLAFGHEGLIPFRQKQPVPDVLPVDPAPCLSKTVCGSAAAHCGVGARLTRAREVRGCTLRGLAQRAGLSAQAVLYIENAKVVPKVDTCELLAVALDVAPGWLAYGEGQGPDASAGA